MANTEKCKFLQWDGTCEIAPKPKLSLTVGDTVIADGTPGVPSQATTLLEGPTRYGCSGAIGFFESTRINKQKSCDQYKPRGN